jgi:hypothetical protein
MYGKVTGSFLFFMISLGSAAQKTSEVQAAVVPIINIKTVPPNLPTQNLSFFCRQELQLQKATRLPLYIRLGSKEYVDRMEYPKRRAGW